jgi:hypothetical protein
MESRAVQMKDSRARSSDCIKMNGMETLVGRESRTKKWTKLVDMTKIMSTYD